MVTALILGAGFSRSAGLPLTRDLFNSRELPPSKSEQDRIGLEEVAEAHDFWKASHPNESAEVWLKGIFESGKNSKALFGTTWENAIQFALRRLVRVQNAHPDPYYHGICTAYVHPIHDRFWRFIKGNFDLKSIVTLNYDILVEQALHRSYEKHRTAPECYYGGFMYTQTVRKMKNITSKDNVELVQLGNKYCLYKLHGSINWAWEHSPTMKIHDDVRAAFRREPKYRPAIIPPLPEKELPKEFSQIWNEARIALRGADTWIVCGYSMPDYDLALKEFFLETMTSPTLKRLIILDPNSDQLKSKWVTESKSLKITSLPGLPEALDYNWTTGNPLPKGDSSDQLSLF